MIINKVTVGFVTQQWDTEKKEWVSQEFVAGDACDYEDQVGNLVDSELMNPGGDEPYLPFDMVNPQN